MQTEARTAPINIRARHTQRELIDRAAAAQHKSRSDFILEAACKEAENVLLDQRLFLLDERQFAEFAAALRQGRKPAARNAAFPSGTVGRVTAPEPLTASHETGGFACGVPSLDDWLKKQALKNEVSGASRTYVVCESGSRNVVGFYALATGSVARKQAPGRISRQMPEPVPVAVLGRLAVDERWHGCGIGSGLRKMRSSAQWLRPGMSASAPCLSMR